MTFTRTHRTLQVSRHSISTTNNLHEIQQDCSPPPSLQLATRLPLFLEYYSERLWQKAFDRNPPSCDAPCFLDLGQSHSPIHTE
ncbi:hypothetical protein CEXT_785241 [Caerostris extrusa]|uniref:Uncharacterized protein n=1 Tax=Caerostris extrusa TaxID=172846 RepID=A0AAV4YBL3_CAEEX|nr:hypothetical protein CEXT_785241 [Caerostris extrusa]